MPATGVGSPGLRSPGQHVALLFSLVQLVAESPSLGKQAPTPVVLLVCLYVCMFCLFVFGNREKYIQNITESVYANNCIPLGQA